jgi:hypothetical protein
MNKGIRSTMPVAVSADLLAHTPPLWATLAALWSVEFPVAGGGAATNSHACIVSDQDDDRGPAPPLAGPLAPSHTAPQADRLIVPPAAACVEAGPAQATDIRFADHPCVPWPWRGRRVQARIAVASAPASAQHRRTVLAHDTGGRALWTIEPSGGAFIHRSHMALPRVAAHEPLVQAAGGDHFVGVLPLWHFVATQCAAQAEQMPPPSACFMVDDPNLHWPRYGHVDFAAIARDAERHDYHVAFATIPLDAWYSHAGAVAVFRAQSRRVSLLVHGNNHGRDELARVPSATAGAQLLGQALRRILALEARTGLQVRRIMVPPHGACAASLLGLLPAQGFEAACVSFGSLLARNPLAAWAPTLGFAPIDLIEDCPVLPRWSLTAVSPAQQLAAAYLGQPLILRVHERDLKDGLGGFADAARFINGLGTVTWQDPGEIARSQLRWRIDGSRCRVRPLALRCRLPLPPGCDEFVVVAGPHAWQASVDGRWIASCRPGMALHPPAGPGQMLELSRVIDSGTVLPSLPAPRTPTRLILRRLLTEARDRLLAV